MLQQHARRAAQYVRMSTEHQRYSPEAQTLANSAYAAERGIQIVRTYLDAGVSGLTLAHRLGLSSLLRDITSGAADYDVILVYDVSRWGRFQDPDESAHYEFLCRAAGVPVIYTAEPFENDGSLIGTLVKHIKRTMAAEYSRELSVKISHAQRGLSAAGYWCGSPAVYGYRRCELNLDGSPHRILEAGEWKALQGRRIKLVLGPDQEVATVRRIFKMFVIHGLSMKAIIQQLNEEGIPAARGAPWTWSRLSRLLRDEKYCGTVVFGRKRTRLRKTLPQPPVEWIRVPGGCPAIVSASLWELARLNVEHLAHRPSDDVLLHQLRALLEEHGRLSTSIINDDPDTYCATVFQERFGGLMGAYRRIGYEPSSRQRAASATRHRQLIPGWPGRHVHISPAEAVVRLRALLAKHGHLSAELIDRSPEVPTASTLRRWFGGMSGVYMAMGYYPDPEHMRRWPGRRLAKRKQAQHLGHQEDHQRDGHHENPPARGMGLEPPADPDT